MTYNIMELSFIYGHVGQRERTCRIPGKIRDMVPQLDVIAFQEAFMGGCWPESLNLRDLLAVYSFPYTTQTVGEPITDNHLQNGGSFIASRWPILQEASHVFKKTKKETLEFAWRKGVGYAKLAKSFEGKLKIYHVFNIHLYAYGGQQLNIDQANEVSDFVNSLNIPSTEPVFYTGDYNADLYKHYNPVVPEILATLKAKVPDIEGSAKSTWSMKNPLILAQRIASTYWTPHLDESEQWIDYTLYSAEHQQPLFATMSVVKPQAAEPFHICADDKKGDDFYVWPDNDDYCRFPGMPLHDLSDHYAVLGRFQLP